MTPLLFTDRYQTMSDSDSDDSAPLERVSSITHPKEYDLVPDDIDYKLKVKQKGQKSRRFIYTLKQGVALPYTTSIEGTVLLIEKLKAANFFFVIC